ncbi:MAG: magnesium transporter [Gammaproteobacteria bacterium]|jgi:magnesium transporter|nr:magnesium transporter [Gammaproteobacteria bacterium]HJN94241.1 magnesium transporter [Gammaproteobacteria bacterium]|tara:strand:- start:8378 stop:9736 length:1359 start_codon:yes stop_codon:yes gene_type:complete
MAQVTEAQFQKDPVLALSQAIDSGSLYQVRQMIKTLPTAGIAHLLESSPPKARSVLWQLIDKDAEGEVIQYLNEDLQNDILSELNAEQVAELTEGLETDDLADILQQLPQQLSSQVLQAMDQQDRHRVERILSYDEDTAGGLMNTDTITVRRNHTVELVLRYLRRHERIPEMTDNLLVVNRDDEFLGILPLREVLVSDPNTSVREVMREDIEAIPVGMEATHVAQLFEQHDWVSAPVVDGEGKLLGRITIDDVVDVIRDSTEHSLMSMAGLDEEDDTFAPVVKTARRRALWLGVNLMTAVFASIVIYLFQDTIDQVVYLAVLMPIVANMGGVAGTQTLTLVIRSLALGHISPSNSRWLLIRELGVAGLNGTLWALVVAMITLFWYGDLRLSLIIAAAMLINLVIAALAGAYLPLFLKRINIDPALAGTVALTTVTDSIGFFTFLGLAQVFYL